MMFLFDITYGDGAPTFTLDRIRKLSNVWSISGPSGRVYCGGDYAPDPPDQPHSSSTSRFDVLTDRPSSLESRFDALRLLKDRDLQFDFKVLQEKSSFHIIILEGATNFPLSKIQDILEYGKVDPKIRDWPVAHMPYPTDLFALLRGESVKHFAEWLIKKEKEQHEEGAREQKKSQQKARLFQEKFLTRPISLKNIGEFSKEYSAIDPGLRTLVDDGIGAFFIMRSKNDVGQFVRLVGSTSTAETWPMVQSSMEFVLNFGKVQLDIETLCAFSMAMAGKDDESPEMKRFSELVEKLAARGRINESHLLEHRLLQMDGSNGAEVLLRVIGNSHLFLQLDGKKLPPIRSGGQQNGQSSANKIKA